MSGKYAGIFANNIADCKKYIEQGYKFIAYVADSYALKAFYENSIEELKTSGTQVAYPRGLIC